MRLLRPVLRDALGLSSGVRAMRTHLSEAMRWLCRAQDATGSGGVARSYTLRFRRRHGRRGWLAAYPETTGYIIPTFFEYASVSGDADFAKRAVLARLPLFIGESQE